MVVKFDVINKGETFKLEFDTNECDRTPFDDVTAAGDQLLYDNGIWYIAVHIGDKKYLCPTDMYYSVKRWDRTQHCVTAWAEIRSPWLKEYHGHCDSTLALLGGICV